LREDDVDHCSLSLSFAISLIAAYPIRPLPESTELFRTAVREGGNPY
jgi:hypothetical protein